jgi:tetratricopeptide (TPR) repeat protein
VSPELIEVGTGATKWQQPFDAALTDVFQVQGDIASRVADALNVALGSDQKKSLTARPTANLAAYDAFLKAEAASEGLASQDVLGLRRAMGLYEQAVALDSTFVEAWAHLARTGAAIYFQGHTTDLEAVRRAAERAMALAPQHPDAYLAKGDYLSNVGNDAAGGLAAYEAGLKLAPDNAELLTASALAEQSLGRWEAALGHLERARALDPRSVLTARRLATTYLWLRRHPQALAAADRTLSLAPDNLTAMEVKAQVFLAQGDLAAARGVIRDAIAGSDPATVAAFFGNYWDLYWALDEHEQDLIPRLTPSAFGEDRGAWGIVLAQVLYLRGNTAKARAYADSTRIAFEEVLRAAPEDDQHHALLGIALAIMGRKADAIREAQRAVELRGLSKDAYSGAYNQHLLARTYTLVGEYDKAIDVLEPLLKVPYFVSPAWLKVDPNFAPLRGNPRFQRLVAGQ